jgi:hypothetical protein
VGVIQTIVDEINWDFHLCCGIFPSAPGKMHRQFPPRALPSETHDRCSVSQKVSAVLNAAFTPLVSSRVIYIIVYVHKHVDVKFNSPLSNKQNIVDASSV